MARGLEQKQNGLRKAAVGDDGLTNEVRLAIEILVATPREDDLGIGFEFLAGAAFAVAVYLLFAELIFERQHDQADGGDDLAHGKGSGNRMEQLRIARNGRPQHSNGKRPGDKAEDGQSGSGGDAPEDVEHEEGRGEVQGTFDKNERPAATRHHADPQAGATQGDAERKAEPAGQTAPGNRPEASRRKAKSPQGSGIAKT